jgi:parvulin-like peptidyl-prolyl isomerase
VAKLIKWRYLTLFRFHRKGGIFLAETAHSSKKSFYLPQILVFILIIAVGGFWLWRVYGGDWVVQVNGVKITDQALESEVASAEAMLQMQGIALEGEQGEMMQGMLRQQVLSQLVDRALISHAAQSCGLKVGQEKLDQQIMLFQMQVGGAENFQKLIQEQGMTEAEYREALEEMMLIQELQTYVTKDVTVEEEEIKKFYEEQKEVLIYPERVNVGHILVETEEEAKEVITELKQGADFQELALEKSIDPSVAENKGVLGDITKESSLVEEFIEEAFSLSSGEFSQEPVKSEYGYHVLWNFERKEAGQASYDEVKDHLQQELLAQKQQERYNEYIEGLRSNGKLLWHPEKSLDL